MKPSTIFRSVLAALAVAAAMWTSPAPAAAHSGLSTYLYLDVTDSTLGGRVEMPVPFMREALGFTLVGNDEALLSELIASEDRIDAYLEEHFEIGAGGAVFDKEFETPTLFYSDAEEESDNYVVVGFEVDLPTSTVPRQLDVTFDPFLDELDGRDALLLIANDWEGGVIENEREWLVAFTAAERTHSVDLGDTGWIKTFTESVDLGVDHIRTGPDHILFILVLLLPSVLVFSSAWRPAKSFRSALWRVSKIVTMFTVAHTITFSLAGLEILPLPPSKLVEAIIALSIAAAALHNLKPIAVNKEWLIAFAFGLFHGMGFASLVEGLDVDRSTQLIALAGRNVGIEIGQTGVVLLMFPALFLLRRTRYFRGFFTVASIALVLVSLGWMIERVFEVDLKVSKVVEPLVAWPKSLGYIAVFTVICAGLFLLERSKGRLIALDAGDDAPSVVDEPATVDA